jgi:predicted nucleotidyltransferase
MKIDKVTQASIRRSDEKTKGTKRTMLRQDTILKALLSSETRITILAHYFRHPEEDFYARQLERLLQQSVPKLRRELLNLERVGLLLASWQGNQKRYKLNHAFPIYEELSRIFLKTAGLGDIIRKHLSDVKGVELAFIYGSFAKGEERAESDIDVMVVGETSEMELSTVFRQIELELGRPGKVNYSLFGRGETKQRLKEGRGFIPAVFSEPKIVIQGDPNDELLRRESGRLGQGRNAEARGVHGSADQNRS